MRNRNDFAVGTVKVIMHEYYRNYGEGRQEPLVVSQQYSCKITQLVTRLSDPQDNNGEL